MCHNKDMKGKREEDTSKEAEILKNCQRPGKAKQTVSRQGAQSKNPRGGEPRKKLEESHLPTTLTGHCPTNGDYD